MTLVYVGSISEQVNCLTMTSPILSEMTEITLLFLHMPKYRKKNTYLLCDVEHTVNTYTFHLSFNELKS